MGEEILFTQWLEVKKERDIITRLKANDNLMLNEELDKNKKGKKKKFIRGQKPLRVPIMKFKKGKKRKPKKKKKKGKRGQKAGVLTIYTNKVTDEFLPHVEHYDVIVEEINKKIEENTRFQEDLTDHRIKSSARTQFRPKTDDKDKREKGQVEEEEDVQSSPKLQFKTYIYDKETVKKDYAQMLTKIEAKKKKLMGEEMYEKMATKAERDAESAKLKAEEEQKEAAKKKKSSSRSKKRPSNKKWNRTNKQE